MLIFRPVPKALKRHNVMVKEIKRFARKYHRLLELEDWEVSIEYKSAPDDENMNFDSAAADCICLW